MRSAPDRARLEFHHAHGLTGQGKTVHDRRLPNTEPRLRELFEKLVAKFGAVLVVVDQVANIGALPIAAARASGCRVACLPGLSMRRAADLYPGEAKTDACDAFVIADTARTMPHTLRAVDRDDETLAELTMLTGYDNDLAGEINRTTNRLRGLLSQIHPSLERVVSPRLAYPYTQALLQLHGSPARLKKLGRARCEALLKAHGSRKAHHLTTEIFDALAEQTLVVSGTEASALIVPGLAAQLDVGVLPKVPNRVRMNVPSYVAGRSTAENPGCPVSAMQAPRRGSSRTLLRTTPEATARHIETLLPPFNP